MSYQNKIIIISLLLILIFSISTSAEKTNEEMYQDMSFRNPFIDYVEPKPEPEPGSREEQENIITFEDVKNGLPFKLNGIITSDKQRIAIVDTGDGIKFIRNYYEKDGYKITSIYADGILVQNRGFNIRLKIGGEIDEK